MPKYVITERAPLKGRIKVSGAKNSVLPIIAASLLADQQSVIEDVPYLNDVKVMCDLLGSLGAEIRYADNNEKLMISPNRLDNETAPYELVNKCERLFL